MIPDEARTRVPPWVYAVVGLTLATGKFFHRAETQLMNSNERSFIRPDHDTQEIGDCQRSSFTRVLQRTDYVSLSILCPIPSLSSLHRLLRCLTRLTIRYRNSILSFHSAVTGLSQQGSRAVDEKTPLAKGMSRSSTSASSEVGVTKHERWAQH